ncbi:MAG: hypothetical protein CMJ18_07185 [Phycisphaeraceae bacterium]|nr:hypothetical protein [Phycisphaeraceae bacterium]
MEADDVLLTQRFLPEHGGSIRWMHEVYRRWPRPVHVITHDYYGHAPRIPEFPDVPERPPSGDHVDDANLTVERRDIFFHDWGLQSPANVGRYWRMTRAVRPRTGPGRRLVVHCTHVLPEVFSLLPLCWGRRRCRIVCYAHGEEITACESSRQLRFMMRRAYARVDVLLANSRYTADLAAQYVPDERIHIVHPGVDTDEFEAADEAGRAWRRQHGYEDRFVVLTVGRLDPRKNQAAVLEATRRLAERFPEILYVVAGEGRELDRLRESAEDPALAGRVIFTGPVDGALKRALFGACDVFAMPAIRDGTDVEGFGIVFLEAGACGKPVIAGRVGGQADAVEDDRTGLIVDGTDHAAVTDALARLRGDADLRRRCGAEGRARALDHRWSRVVERTVGIVETLRAS